MRKLTILWLLLACFAGGAVRGQATPGGIAAPAYRFVAETKSKTFSSTAVEIHSVFAVFEPTGTTESVVWSAGRQDTTLTVLTTHRLADLQRGEYLSFPDESCGPRLRTFVSEGETTGLELRPEATFAFPEIPAEQTGAGLRELLVYDRRLSAREQQCVESYLALKYGLSLERAAPTHYCFRDTPPLWNALTNAAFPHRVAGMGRIGAADFNASSAGSRSCASGLVELTADPFPEGAFLSWSDNGAPLARPREAASPLLQRRWVLQRTGHGLPPVSWRLRPRQLFDQAPRDSDWKLVVDTSGTGRFLPENCLETDGKNVDLNNWSPTVHFTFAAPRTGLPATNDFFTATALTPNPTPDGRFQLRAEFRQPQPLIVSVVTATGRRLTTHALAPTAYHLFNGELPARGVYFLELVAGDHRRSLRIVYP